MNDEWAICTIKNSNVYYLAKANIKTGECVWVTTLKTAKTFESKGLAEYYAATRHVRRFHIRSV